MAAGGACCLGRLLHEDCRDTENDKQKRQEKEHVREGHHHALLMRQLSQLLHRHRLCVAAIALEARGQIVERFQRRRTRPSHGLVQAREVEIGPVVQDRSTALRAI